MKIIKYLVLVVLIIIFGIYITYYNNYNFNKVKEALEIDDKKCSENCSLVPISAKLNLITLKVNDLEKKTNKNTSNIKIINDRIKKEEEEFKKALKPT